MSREMKESGIQWIGDMPAEWICNRVKLHLHVNHGSDPHTEGNIPVYGSGTESFKTCGEYKIGPAILLGRKGSIENPRYVEEKFWNVDTAFDAEVYSDDMLPKFFYYLACVFDYKSYISQTTLPSMTQGDYKNMNIPVPPLPEQQAISAFLDLKCSAIDDSITKHKAIIDKLEEYRKALITQTVTKGFDSNAEMKDSGDNIIGAIPSSWECIRLKFLLSNEKNNLRVGPFGSSLPRKSYTDKGPWVYNQRCVLDNNFVTNDTHISENKFEELSGFQVYDGDILITTRGTIGRTAIVPYGSPKGILHPCLIRFRLDNNIISNKFIMFLFNYTDLPMGQIKRNSGSTTIEALYSGPLKDVFIPLPNKEEQELIIKTIETFNQKIDNALSQHNMLIAKLKEYKQSLIYNAVTGKIDCRKDV